MITHHTSDAEEILGAKVVALIMDGKTKLALKLLSDHFGIDEPHLRVGTVKSHRGVVACYVQKERRIYLSRSELWTNPFIVLHEFYHHLRASQVTRKQVDKRADQFALKLIQDFVKISSGGWSGQRDGLSR